MKLTSTELELVHLGVETLIVIIAGWDLIFKTETKSWYKRISKIGWVLILLASGDFVNSVLKLNVDEGEKNKQTENYKKDRKADRDTILNGVEIAFNKHNLSYNPVSKTITVLDTSARRDPDPVMDVVRDSIYFHGTLEVPHIDFMFRTINNGISYNVKCEMTLFSFKGNQFQLITKGPKVGNGFLKSYQSSGMKYHSYTLSMPKKPNPKDTTYIFFRAVYSNRQFGGKYQDPLRKLYYVCLESYPKTLKDIKIFEVADPTILDSATESLIKNKYW